MEHAVVLVDEDDQPLGSAEKLRAHTEGWLHRAFSVFIFDPAGRLLLQRRTVDKYHSGGLWSNTCCSHPQPGEAPLDGAHRRLTEEMGFDCPLTSAFQETYHISVGPNMVEHEHDRVFVGTVNTPDIRPDADEVADWTWVEPLALRRDVDAHQHRYTPWFRLLLDRALSSSPVPPERDPLSSKSGS